MFRIDRSRVHINATEVVRIYAEKEEEEEADELQPPEINEDDRDDAPYDAEAEDGSETGIETEPTETEIEPEIEMPDAIKAMSEQAAAEARETVFQAELDSVKIKADAEALGYKEGAKRADERYAALLSENKESLSRVISEMEAGRTKMLASMEEEIIELCFAIVRKISDVDRTKDGEIFKTAIRKALARTDMASTITIQLSSEDFERFFPEGEAVFDTPDGRVTVAVAGSSELDGGDIVIDSEDETITAGIGTQIKNIELRFRQRLGKTDENN